MVEETVPPDDERFTFHASWAIEAYTPLHANCLVEGLSALGYDAEGSLRNRSVSESLTRARSTPHGGTWLNLDTIFPRGKQHFLGIEGELPLGIRCARPAVHVLTPSVTVLVTQFVYDDDTAQAFDALARETDFRAEGHASGRSVSVRPPKQVKQQARRDLRVEHRERGVEWVRRNIPGVFSSGVGGISMLRGRSRYDRNHQPFRSRGNGIELHGLRARRAGCDDRRQSQRCSCFCRMATSVGG
jgi:hypothetical protein